MAAAYLTSVYLHYSLVEENNYELYALDHGSCAVERGVSWSPFIRLPGFLISTT
jgi:hypothetical protein